MKNREIDLGDLLPTMNKEPSLVDAIAAQIGLKSKDPQVVFDAYIAKINRDGEIALWKELGSDSHD